MSACAAPAAPEFLQGAPVPKGCRWPECACKTAEDCAMTSALPLAVTQGELIPMEQLPDSIFSDEERGDAPRYTAERLKSKRPEDYRRVMSMLAGGMGLLAIARMVRVHHMTVAAVRDQAGDQIDMIKQGIRRNVRLAVAIAAERLPEVMANLTAAQMPIATAVLIDKLAQLDGEPTQRIEVKHTGHVTHAELAAELSAFPDAIEVETSPAGMGRSGPEASQKALSQGDATPETRDAQPIT